MELKNYFQKVRAVESSIPDEHTVIVSLETADGGCEGRLSEVSRELAAKLIVQGKARLAEDDEAEDFRLANRSASKAAAELTKVERVQLNLMQEADLQLLRNALRREDSE